MSDLAGRADRTWAPAEIDRVARSVRRQIWPEAGLLERVDVDRLAATPHTVVGPRGRILVLLVHHRGLPAHRWLEAHAVGDGVLLHANAASWREILDGHPRTRFGVAHELGHAVLHTPQLRDFAAGPPLERDDTVEREANRFAACLLAPADALREAVRLRLDCSPEGVAERWGLGSATARARLQEVAISTA